MPCSVLVANNGMAAVKFIRSVQDWAYKSFGNEHAVALVAMATPEDMRVDAEHIKMADQFVEVPGGSNANNYANVRLIVQTAEKANVDAVWPGWYAPLLTCSPAFDPMTPKSGSPNTCLGCKHVPGYNELACTHKMGHLVSLTLGHIPPVDITIM